MFVFYTFQCCHLCSLYIQIKNGISNCVSKQLYLFILIFTDFDDLVVPLKRTSFSALFFLWVLFCFSLPTYLFYLQLCFLCLSLLRVSQQIQKEARVSRKADNSLNMTADLLEMDINTVFCNEVMVSNSNQAV